MATQEYTYKNAPNQLTANVRSACVAFLGRKNVVVVDPQDPICIAQAMLVYMGVGAQHPVNGVNHALLVIDTFYKSRVNPPAEPQKPVTLTKKQRRKAKALAGKRSSNPGQSQQGKAKCDRKPAPTFHPFYGSVEWKRVRYEALKRSSGRCECCGRSPKEGAILNIDHIKPLRKFPHLALDINNLQVLCATCNHGKGSWDSTDWRVPQSEEKTSLDREYEHIMGPVPRAA